MDRLERVISTLSYVMGDRRKRHIVGGIMLSVAMLFGGLAVTVITIKNEEQDNDEQDFE